MRQYRMDGEARVYVVDDDESIRSGLQLLLESNGWKAETYATAEAFLLAYAPRRHACLLLDLDMPGMNGAELQTELAARGISLPIIVMTAHDERPLVRRVREAGAMAVLRKPFRADTLLPLIETAITRDSVSVYHRRTEEGAMTDLIRQLRLDHLNVSKVLGILRDQLQAIELEQAADYELTQDAMLYMTRYPDISHHPTEDRIFAFVVLHAPHAKKVADELTREHAALAEKGMTFLDALRKVADGAMVERDLIASRGHEYIEFLDYHMMKEEDQIFPLAETVLQEADWQAVQDAMTDSYDPLFGPVVEDDYQRLYRSITQNMS